MRQVRGLSSRAGLTWFACVPLALFILGVFNLSAHAAELPELTPAFLINNLWLRRLWKSHPIHGTMAL
jgi:Amt family ammonium transporter